ncbi:MAG TPA: hypothetical protein VGK25_07140 [Ignavibacteria bacterium]
MKRFKTFILASTLLVALIAGCNKTDSVLGPNGLNNQASFTISQQNGVNGGVDFMFKPSVDTRILLVVSRLPEQQFADTNVNVNTNYVFSKDTSYKINEYIGVANGQQWKFDFTGSLPNQSSNYTITTNYTAH